MRNVISSKPQSEAHKTGFNPDCTLHTTRLSLIIPFEWDVISLHLRNIKCKTSFSHFKGVNLNNCNNRTDRQTCELNDWFSWRRVRYPKKETAPGLSERHLLPKLNGCRPHTMILQKPIYLSFSKIHVIFNINLWYKRRRRGIWKKLSG